MMSSEDKAAIQEIVCLVEQDLRQKEHKAERKLVTLELCLLPIAIALLVMYPVPAAWAVFLPNVGLRAYQILRGQ